MAIEDGAILAGCVAQGDTLVASLRRYESLRRTRTRAIQMGSRRNARLYHLSGKEARERDRTDAGQRRAATLEWLYRYDALDPDLADPGTPEDFDPS